MMQPVRLTSPSRLELRLFCAVALATAAGCTSGQAAIPPVDVDVQRVAQHLMAELDTDRNGALSQRELAAMPALADCLSQCRRDSKKEITAEQLTTRLERIFDRSSSLVSASCIVRRNGKPLPAAEVRFVPLPVFKDILPIGSGVTDSEGVALISAAPGDLPSVAPRVPGLMPPGMYLVEITHPSVDIPEKYNRQTTFGKEISIETVYRGGLVLDMKL